MIVTSYTEVHLSRDTGDSAFMQEYIRRNPIPLEGSWDVVSGEEFLRKLLTEGVDATSYKGGVRDPLFSCVGTIGVDPRAIGQRVMDIRSALAKEFIQVSHSISNSLPALAQSFQSPGSCSW